MLAIIAEAIYFNVNNWAEYMGNIQRRYLIIGAISLLGCTSGCMTYSPARRMYTEAFSSIYLTEDRRRMVVFGRYYQYIFDVNPTIVATVSAPYHRFVTAFFEDFSVDKDNLVSGIIRLSLASAAGPENLQQARLNGYIGGTGDLIARVIIRGRRYTANHNLPVKGYNELNQEYLVKVLESTSKAPVSPVKKVAGDILMLGLSPLYLVGIVGFAGMMYVKCISKSACEP